MNQEKRAVLSNFLEDLYQKGNFNGNVLVAEDGEVLYKAALGTAHFQSGRKLDEGTIFDLASLSKAFTAMAVMILKEQGKLSYEDNIEMYLGELPYKDVTIGNLLNHTGGLPDYIPLFLDKWDENQIASNKDVIPMLTAFEPELLFQPGEQFQYSNTGYVFLALIIEQVTGMSYAAYLKKQIFEPLGMHHTTVMNRRLNGFEPENLAYGYISVKEKDGTQGIRLPEDLPEMDFVRYMDGMQGDGAISSNLEDLYKWDQALYTEKLVSAKTLQEAFTPGTLNDKTFFPYGFGWGIMNRKETKVVRHSGGWPGYKTNLIRYVDVNKTIIVLCNVQQDDAFHLELAENLEKILFEEVRK